MVVIDDFPFLSNPWLCAQSSFFTDYQHSGLWNSAGPHCACCARLHLDITHHFPSHSVCMTPLFTGPLPSAQPTNMLRSQTLKPTAPSTPLATALTPVLVSSQHARLPWFFSPFPPIHHTADWLIFLIPLVTWFSKTFNGSPVLINKAQTP